MMHEMCIKCKYLDNCGDDLPCKTCTKYCKMKADLYDVRERLENSDKVHEFNGDNIFLAAYHMYGIKNQEIVVIEKMETLIKEIARKLRGEKDINKIAEEIADVHIMLTQLKRIYGIFGNVEEWQKLRWIDGEKICYQI